VRATLLLGPWEQAAAPLCPALPPAALKHEGRPKAPFDQPLHPELFGGADRSRTDDLLNAIQALSQLSYGPSGMRGVR
jgi:hypothetical protein